MGRVTKKTPAGQAGSKSGDGQATEAPAPKKSRVNHYGPGKVKLTDDIKLPPQERVIVALIQEAGKAGISRKDLIAAMDGKVTTRQPLERILGYYQNDMVARELIVVEKKEVEAAPAGSSEAA